MKIFYCFLFVLLSVNAPAQTDSLHNMHAAGRHLYVRHSAMVTISAGFIDLYRQDFTLPKGFDKSNTSGYGLVYGRLEYGVSRKVSLAAAFSYDAFTYNYNQLYTGYNGIIKRYHADHFRLLSGGVTAFYHLGDAIHIKNLDPFIGLGGSLNNIRNSELAQGDSTVTSRKHTTEPYLKIGARYYLTPKCSLFADLGYDRLSIFSIGFSCRFFPKKG